MLVSCSEEDKVHMKDALWKGCLVPWCVISPPATGEKHDTFASASADEMVL